MKYEYFIIENYRAVKGPLKIDLSKRNLLPLIGLNECGKTTILQAIFSFDSVNDSEYEGRHIKEINNLYATQDASAIISAGIKGTKKKWAWVTERWSIAYKKEINTTLKKIGETVATQETKARAITLQNQLESIEQWLINFSDHYEKRAGELEIARNLNSRQYSINGFNSSSTVVTDAFCKKALTHMPYILYNDDFQDRPPSSISISEDGDGQWEQIFTKLFSSAGHNLLEVAKEPDKRRKSSIVSDVQTILNQTLSKAWKSFHLDSSKKVEISLNLDEEDEEGEPVLNISIVENKGNSKRFFEVVDRSKGFLWFYNFVMKTEFNPKALEDRSATIYLLDEPGSYLHSAAQSKLCQKLSSISKNNGKVIYCTHSPHLLNPEFIRINDIHVVVKDNSKVIDAKRLPDCKTVSTKITALQPVYEALQNTPPFLDDEDERLLVVEGIYDKYVLEIFLPKLDGLKILPSVNAHSIVQNIQFLNAYRKNYIALWDNDDEGRKEHARASKCFGEEEAKKFILLPLVDRRSMKMEKMFEEEDYVRFKEVLELPTNATYESVMVEAYYSNSSLRQKLIEVCSQTSEENFKSLGVLIETTKTQRKLPASK